MQDKENSSCGREKDELTQAYESYDDYAFPNNYTCYPCCKNVAYSVICTPTDDECQLPNYKCVLHKGTACTSITLPGFEIDSSSRAPMIMFNTYMNKFT